MASRPQCLGDIELLGSQRLEELCYRDRLRGGGGKVLRGTLRGFVMPKGAAGGVRTGLSVEDYSDSTRGADDKFRRGMRKKIFTVRVLRSHRGAVGVPLLEMPMARLDGT